MTCSQQGRGRAIRGLVVFIFLAQLMSPAQLPATPADSTRQGQIDLREVERRAKKPSANPPDLSRLNEGDRVRLLLAMRGEPVEGLLVRAGDADLVVRSLGHENVFAASDVREAWVRRTRTRDATIMLGLAGMVAGGIYGLSKRDGVFCAVPVAPGIGGLSTSYQCPDPFSEGDLLLATAASAALGVFTGLLVGAFSATWEPVRGTAAPAR